MSYSAAVGTREVARRLPLCSGKLFHKDTVLTLTGSALRNEEVMMNFHNLRALLAATKKTFEMHNPSESFYIASAEDTVYIEPPFEKIVFHVEKPSIILISAVGATGKSALARKLSSDLSLPLLDLAKHKPVGDNTLTGILHDAFAAEDMSKVFVGMETGSYGVIIDGVDEARSKTNEGAFEAFLDDLVKVAKAAKNPSLMLLGRTQILEDCWVYLSEAEASVGLVSIAPFTVDDAKKYIDSYTGGPSSPHSTLYKEARDLILKMLGNTFTPTTKTSDREFLSFIGYPPVLDAVVTLLNQEGNYHKLLERISRADGTNVEIELLHRIATYILSREREEKVLPNIVDPLLDGVPKEIHIERDDLYSAEEQCVRLIHYCLREDIQLECISDPRLNEKYETQLAEFLPEHPFLTGREFRNAVFEGLVLANLMVCNENMEAIVMKYVAEHKRSYHLVYMLDAVSDDKVLPSPYLGTLCTAAMEFRSLKTFVDLQLTTPDWNQDIDEIESLEQLDIEIEIEIESREKRDVAKSFLFRSPVASDMCLTLGPRLARTVVAVPCTVELLADEELELTAPVDITARFVKINAKSLILRPHVRGDGGNEVIIEAERLDSILHNIDLNSVELSFYVVDSSGIAYPAITYSVVRTPPPEDPLLRQKYFRLRRILQEFRSHGRGGLAKYRHKIEHERVLRNEVGRSVLNELLNDGILKLHGNLYFLDSEQLSSELGISWQGLRRGEMPQRLMDYLRDIS